MSNAKNPAASTAGKKKPVAGTEKGNKITSRTTTRKRAKKKAIPFYRIVALLLAGVGVVLLACSLTHLAHGVHMITGDNWVLAWCLAIGIDAGIIGLKLATVVGQRKPVWKEIGHTTNFFLVFALSLSAGLNVLSYTDIQLTDSQRFVASVVLGVFIPSFLWGLSQVSSKVWMDGNKQKIGPKPTPRKQLEPESAPVKKAGGPPRSRRGSRGSKATTKKAAA